MLGALNLEIHLALKQRYRTREACHHQPAAYMGYYDYCVGKGMPNGNFTGNVGWRFAKALRYAKG